MNFAIVLFLALVQGAAELLPVSSSAHVIAAETFLGLDPSAPEMTFLLVMLHTGTMFAVLLHYWRDWMKLFFGNSASMKATVVRTAVAVLATGVIGYALKHLIEHYFLGSAAGKGEIEELFSKLWLVGGALITAGILILISARAPIREVRGELTVENDLSVRQALGVGAIQGFCLPFRGLSRSGATISVGLLQGIPVRICEGFSFLLAVVVTPPVLLKEFLRLRKFHQGESHLEFAPLLLPGLVGMVAAFFAGWVALKVLSNALSHGKWKYFGFYCLAAGSGLITMHFLR